MRLRVNTVAVSARGTQADESGGQAGAGSPREQEGGDRLVASAKQLMEDALQAWAEDDYGRVSMLAPIAVEHLGKAVVWKHNPALLVPLAQDAEASLFILANNPDLENPSLRTVGLMALLGRLDRLLGGLALDAKRRRRMVEMRNGAIHVGSAGESRHVLLDALMLSSSLLERLQMTPARFYGEHVGDVEKLLDAKRTEVSLNVAAKRARARRRLGQLEERLGEELFQTTTDLLEEQARDALVASMSIGNLEGRAEQCPECGSEGRLFGEVDVDADVDFDVEPVGDGRYESTPYVAGWIISMYPREFDCHVCGLTLVGADELGEGGLPTQRHEVSQDSLGDHFAPEEYGV